MLRLMKRSSLSLSLSLVAMAVASVLLIDSTAHANEGGRERRGSRAVTQPQAAPPQQAAPVAASAPSVCYVTEVIEAPAPVISTPGSEPSASSDGRQRRSSNRQAQPAPAQAAPQVITRAVPCEPAPQASNTPVSDPAPPGPSYTPPPGLLSEVNTPSFRPSDGLVPVGGGSLAQSNFVAIPEPSILALLGVGVVGALVVRRRRQS